VPSETTLIFDTRVLLTILPEHNFRPHCAERPSERDDHQANRGAAAQARANGGLSEGLRGEEVSRPKQAVVGWASLLSLRWHQIFGVISKRLYFALDTCRFADWFLAIISAVSWSKVLSQAEIFPR
jgi:hypothetical protein